MKNIERQLIESISFSPKSLEFPDSWIGHLPFAAFLIEKCRPEIFVELGTHSGNSYFSFCQAVKENKIQTKCYAIDSWKGEEHAGIYGEEIFEKVNTHNQKHYASFSKLMRMQFDEAADYFSDSCIGLLHIDGFHTYDAVKHDFETWEKKLTPNAFIIFHDINVREQNFGVWKFWEEMKARYPLNIDFLHSHGLGVVFTGNDEQSFPWMHPQTEEQKIVQTFFQNIGEKQFHAYNLLREQEKNKYLKDEINNLHIQFENLKAEHNIYKAEYNMRIDTLQNELTHKESFFRETEHNLYAEISFLQQSCNEFTQSRSWRITKPLRIVGQIIRNKKKFLIQTKH